MTISSYLERLFRGHDGDSRRASVDQEIERHRATVRQNTQVIQSGARVMQHMAGAMKMVTEADNAGIT